MPQDPTSLAYDAVLAKERAEAEQYFKENDPSVLDLPPAQRESIVRDLARTFAADEAANTAGMGSRLKSAYAEHAPTTTADIGIGRFTVGKGADLLNVGPQSWQENPVGAAASTMALAASALPGGALISRLPGSTAKMLGMGVESGMGGIFTAARKGEQIIGPAAAAGVGGGFAQAYEDLNGVPEIPVSTDSKDPMSPATVFTSALERAKKEALFEAKGGLIGLGMALGVKGAAVWARGSKEHFDNAMESMRLAGIRGETYGLQEVTDNRLIRGASGVLGVMPIPIIAKKFVKRKEAVSDELGRIQSNFLDDASPGFSVLRDLYERDPKRVGRLLEQKNDEAFKAVSAASQRYGIVRESINNTVTSLIRTERVASAAASTRVTALQRLSSIASRRDLPFTRDAQGNVTNMRVLAGFSRPVVNFLTDIQNMPPGAIPIDRLIALKNQARDALNKINPNNPLSNEERVTLASIKSAIEGDITSAIQAGGSQQLKDSYSRLATYDGDWLSLLSGHVDRRASKIQTTWGNEKLSQSSGQTFNLPEGFQRHQGARDMGEFIDDMLKNAGPQEIREFSTLIRESGQQGAESIQFAAARKLDQIFQSSKTFANEGGIEVLHSKRVLDAIRGGTGEGGKHEQAFWQLMEEAGVPYDRFIAFTKAADKLWSQFPPDSSKYLARKVILSGGDPLKSIARAATGGLIGTAAMTGGAGAALGSSGLGVLFSAVMLDQYSRLATSPRYLNMVVQILDPKTTSGVKAKLVDRFMASTFFRDYVNKEKISAGQAADVVAGALNKAQAADPLQRLTDQATSYFRQNPAAAP